jgi:hypothetical protein
MSADVEVVFTPWPYDAVARGVALLDEKVPGWREWPGIDLSRLDLRNPSRCIAGQLGVWSLVESDAYHGFDVFDVCGFPSDVSAAYAALDAAWREAIAGGAA